MVFDNKTVTFACFCEDSYYFSHDIKYSFYYIQFNSIQFSGLIKTETLAVCFKCLESPREWKHLVPVDEGFEHTTR